MFGDPGRKATTRYINGLREFGLGYPARMFTFLPAALQAAMPLFLRPIPEFTQPDYAVIWKDEAGKETSVGRIFQTDTARADGKTVWFWTMEFHQRQGRSAPHQGHAEDRDAATAAFRRCWESKERRT